MPFYKAHSLPHQTAQKTKAQLTPADGVPDVRNEFEQGGKRENNRKQNIWSGKKTQDGCNRKFSVYAEQIERDFEGMDGMTFAIS